MMTTPEEEERAGGGQQVPERWPEGAHLLTRRQRRVLLLLLAHYSQKEIAEICEVHIRTIGRDIEALKRHFGVKKTPEVASAALEHGYQPRQRDLDI